MQGIAERITDAVAEIDQESGRKQLRQVDQQIARHYELLKRLCRARKSILNEIDARSDVAAHVDALLDSIAEHAIADNAVVTTGAPTAHCPLPAADCEDPERWDGLS